MRNTKWFDYTFLSIGLLIQVVTFAISTFAFSPAEALRLTSNIQHLTSIDIISLVSGCLGICSVCLTAQGRLTAFAFGFAQVFTYTYICLRAHLYGEVAINIYYFATMIYGVYLWRRRISPTTQRVITRQLSWSIWFALIIAIAAFSAAIGYGLARFTDDPTPYMDSFTTVVAIVAQVLMIMAYRDQWFLWFVVDIVSVVMWIYVGNYCMAAQYAFWCCNCIYGYIRWTQLSSSKCPNS
ncbi:MAG: nicotinamide riboside transporter PnuC [Paludibacteraceae bacterium]|nr:nicotinamide riboside transporter PnuC [Paludibacteraceae bacterium]